MALFLLPLATPSVAQGQGGLIEGMVRKHMARVRALGDGRLTVHPHEMATGTKNPPAGQYGYPQDAAKGNEEYIVHVPPQCIGSHRCPLFVFLTGGGGGAHQTEADYVARGGAQYGVIVLVPNFGGQDDFYSVGRVGTALTQVLRQFAIDPDKIGIGGVSNGGALGWLLGRSNMDVFSRIAFISPGGGWNAVNIATSPEHPATQFFLGGGVAEGGFLGGALRMAQWARRHGHPVTQGLTLREHWPYPDDYTLLWRWLQAGWAAPGAVPPPAPLTVPAESLPLLTPEALTQLASFWSRVMQAPDSLRRMVIGRPAANAAYRKTLIVLLGRHHASTILVDLAALAVQDPAVAAALQQAGLSAQQAEELMLAVVTAKATAAGMNAKPIEADVDSGEADVAPPPGSVLARNVAFLAAHPDLLEALESTQLWIVSRVDR